LDCATSGEIIATGFQIPSRGVQHGRWRDRAVSGNRLRLSEAGQSLPDQVGKDTQTPTMRWIFQVFEGIDLLIIRHNGLVVSRRVLNLRKEHITVIHLLGPPVENCYLLNS
jgi:hypothetical protein